jgi:hypothetical protein
MSEYRSYLIDDTKHKNSQYNVTQHNDTDLLIELFYNLNVLMLVLLDIVDF